MMQKMMMEMMAEFESSDEYDDESMPDIYDIEDNKSNKTMTQIRLEEMNTTGDGSKALSVIPTKKNIFHIAPIAKIIKKIKPPRSDHNKNLATYKHGP